MKRKVGKPLLYWIKSNNLEIACHSFISQELRKFSIFKIIFEFSSTNFFNKQQKFSHKNIFRCLKMRWVRRNQNTNNWCSSCDTSSNKWETKCTLWLHSTHEVVRCDMFFKRLERIDEHAFVASNCSIVYIQKYININIQMKILSNWVLHTPSLCIYKQIMMGCCFKMCGTHSFEYIFYSTNDLIANIFCSIVFFCLSKRKKSILVEWSSSCFDYQTNKNSASLESFHPVVEV